jgi:hypothetical protein
MELGSIKLAKVELAPMEITQTQIRTHTPPDSPLARAVACTFARTSMLANTRFPLCSPVPPVVNLLAFLRALRVSAVEKLYSVRLNNGTANASVTTANIVR